MPIVIQEFQPSYRTAVSEFNRRLQGVLDQELQFPQDPRMAWLPKGDHPRVYQEAFLALDNGTMHGGYILKRQPFAMHGEEAIVASYRLPVSEGIADRAYASLGLLMMRDAVRRQPLLFSLGMGAIDRPLPKMQKSMGWIQCAVPFYFRVVHGGRFARQIQPLRRTRVRRLALDLAAYSGAATLGTLAWKVLRRSAAQPGIVVERVQKFGLWANDVWSRCRDRYALIAVRDADILTALYPPEDGRFLRWRLLDGERVLGWVVCIDTRMRGHKQFGNLRVGTIVDCLAEPESAAIVVGAASRELERLGVDLIVSNQSHGSWGQGLRSAGFVAGPSNFIFSASKQLGALTRSSELCASIHINRGDGDGPMHL